MLLSYIAAFSVVVVLFALAVRFSFVAILSADATARISNLARAGTAAVQFVPGGYLVNEATFGGFSLRPESEGLEWFDPSGRLLALRGHVATPERPPREGAERFASPAAAYATYTLPLHDSHGRERGFVRATEKFDIASDPARALDRGLAIGGFFALLAGAAGGTLLARSSVARVEQSYERLREFTADASHELRGPIAALAGTASVALREAPDLEPQTRSRLEDIANLARQMRRLIDDLLILARADRSMERELFVVELDEVIAGVRERYGPEARAKGVLLETVGTAGGEMYGNPDQLERIVANLVENAIRHTAFGGSVVVAWTTDQRRVTIAVRDTGSGIAAEHHARVFDRFWRGERARGSENSGLGLAIAQALARRHGGDIALASEIGKGSTFTLALPLRPPALG